MSKRIEDFPGVVILASGKEHLKDHGLSYWGHMKVAGRFTFTFSKVVLAAICHGVFPFMFKTYCSDKVKEVYKTLK